MSKFPQHRGIEEYKVGVGDIIAFSRLIENKNLQSTNTNKLPEKPENLEYKLGVGDKLALTRLAEKSGNSRIENSGENKSPTILIPSPNDDTINSVGRIGSDGSLLLLEVGRLEAIGKSLNELRSEVRNILIRTGVSPRFQMEIRDFKSQKSLHYF